MKRYLKAWAWKPVFGPDGDGTGTGTSGGTGGTGTGTSGGTGTGGAGTGTGTEGDGQQFDEHGEPIPVFQGGTLTQTQFNAELRKERLKARKKIEQHIKDLERLQNSKNLTEKEKGELQTKIEELQQQVMSKAELHEKEKKRLENDYKTNLDKEKSSSETWRNRYTQATITRSITDAAVGAEAFSPEQIVAFLERNTRLVEDIDAEGNSTGEFTPRVKFNDVDKDNKPVVLDLTVPEAVKRMKELDRFANLFKSNLSGGLGGRQPVAGAGGRPLDPSKMTPEQYAKWRKEHKNLDLSTMRG